MHTAYINIGTNLGNKAKNIDTAITEIEQALSTKSRRSEIVHSKPWGYSSTNDFMNIAIAIDTMLSPQTLLNTLQVIERRIGTSNHRNNDGTYADRLIDIDIMAIDDLIVNTPTLTIPHPHMLTRPFFLIPMLQLAPHWKHPAIESSTHNL
ncbi:MAG: 2-amino-4-hydroxy-6-hydroxymethyldihydropteridine diphosphokinase [Muribaculaceae bacterium]